MICGGIDIGGTKMEARLFDGAGADLITQRRIATPKGDADKVFEAAAGLIEWLGHEASAPVPVGVAIPGVIDPNTGRVEAANLAVSGQAFAKEMKALCGQDLVVVNDGMGFAFSEARGGAAEGATLAVGLVLGTGVGGGVCFGGGMLPRHKGLGLEIGHLGLSAATLARHELPPLLCGCGRVGCVETYVAGNGLRKLTERILGKDLRPEDLTTHPRAEAVLSVWADLAADALLALETALDPDVYVLGGGLSQLPGCAARLQAALKARSLAPWREVPVRLAKFGDSSGARGAAILAREASPC